MAGMTIGSWPPPTGTPEFARMRAEFSKRVLQSTANKEKGMNAKLHAKLGAIIEEIDLLGEALAKSPERLTLHGGRSRRSATEAIGDSPVGGWASRASSIRTLSTIIGASGQARQE
jgi:hypothetical protein